MSRIFFEISDLRRFVAEYQHPSGIQRVVLNVIHHVAERVGGDRAALAFLDFGSGEYRWLPVAQIPGGVADLGSLSTALGGDGAQGSPLPTLGRYIDRPLAYRFHKAIRDWNAARGREAHFARRNSSIAEWLEAKAEAEGLATARRPAPRDLFADARPGDTLVVLDAAWRDRRIIEMHRRAHGAGLQVALLVHDLCPILCPELFPRQAALEFRDWLTRTMAFTDRYLANSQATAADLRAFLDAHGSDAPIDVMPLTQSRLVLPDTAGSRTHAARDCRDRVDIRQGLSDSVASLSTRPYALAVGTLEIRKNLWALAQAWDRLRADTSLDMPRLVLAGRAGWLNEDFEKLMAATGNLGGWIRVVHGPTDAELDHLYRNSLFTVCVSLKEGWGLPIGESLGYGKTGVVSGVSSMPEVGADMVEYCDPRSISSIEEACRRLVAEPDHRVALERRIAGARLRGWGDVADDLVGAIGRGG